MKLPQLPHLEIVKPQPWDFLALGLLVLGGAVAGLNVMAADTDHAGGSISGTLTFLFVLAHLAVCLGGLLVLGKTAKEGTIWGNLAALASCLAGMSGFFLAAALWATA